MTTHDSRYKRFLSNPSIAGQLLTRFVKENFVKELDFSSFELMDKQFVNRKHKRHESDLCYRARCKGREVYIYILMEFQSSVDNRMALRFLQYIIELYEWLERDSEGKLPSVFPLLLYNGEAPWTAAIDTSDLLRNDIPVEYIPRFCYHLIAVNEIDEPALKKMETIIDAALYFERHRKIEGIDREIKKLLDLFQEKEPRLWKELALFIGGVFSASKAINPALEIIETTEAANSMIQTAIREHDEMIRKQGIEQGMQKGKLETRMEMARGLKDSGVSIEIISKNTGLTPEEIDAL